LINFYLISIKRSGSSNNNKIVKYLYWKSFVNMLGFRKEKKKLQKRFIFKQVNIINIYIITIYLINKLNRYKIIIS